MSYEEEDTCHMTWLSSSLHTPPCVTRNLAHVRARSCKYSLDAALLSASTLSACAAYYTHTHTHASKS
jgi:hypothetical protein